MLGAVVRRSAFIEIIGKCNEFNNALGYKRFEIECVCVRVERSDQLGCSEQMIEFMSYVMFSDDQGVFLGYLLYVIG